MADQNELLRDSLIRLHDEIEEICDGIEAQLALLAVYEGAIESSLEVGVFETDANFNFTFASSAVGRAFGVDADELLGVYLFSLRHMRHRDESLHRLHALMCQEGRFHGELIPVTQPSGEVREAILCGSPYFDDDAYLAGYRGVILDLSIASEGFPRTGRRAEEADVQKRWQFRSTPSEPRRDPTANLIPFERA